MRREGFQGQMLLQVHDELLLEAPDEEMDALQGLVQEVMSGVFALRVPLKVDIGTGLTWAEAH
jgi:DNA polymerase-1